ncbi:MAG: MarC family protein [Rhodoferax sp.]
MFAAILPILNPAATAPIFLGLTEGAWPSTRALLDRQIARNMFALMVGSMLVGSDVLEFFGISLPIVRVGGRAHRSRGGMAPAQCQPCQRGPPHYSSRVVHARAGPAPGLLPTDFPWRSLSSLKFDWRRESSTQKSFYCWASRKRVFVVVG